MVSLLLVAKLDMVMCKRRSGFTILEIVVVVALVGLLTAIVVPHVLNARKRADQKTCLNNLREIDQAVQIWAMENKALETDVVTHTNLIPFLRHIPVCPAVKGGTFFSDYGMTFVGEPSYCVVNVNLVSTPHMISGNRAIAARGSRSRR